MENKELKIEKLGHKYKDYISMYKDKDLYIEQIDDIKEKANLITVFGIYTLYFIIFVLTIKFFLNLFGIIILLLIILGTLLFLLFRAIMNNIIIPDKLKEIYKNGYYISGYLEYLPEHHEIIEDIIFEPETIDSYKKRKIEEFKTIYEKRK